MLHCGRIGSSLTCRFPIRRLAMNLPTSLHCAVVSLTFFTTWSAIEHAVAGDWRLQIQTGRLGGQIRW